VQRISPEEHDPAHGIGGVGAQRFTHRREREPSSAMLREHAAAGEQPQQSIYRVWIGAKAFRDRVRGLRPVA
jgi:hypothetical protein